MISKPKLILPEDQVLPTMLEAIYILKMLRQHTIKHDEHLGYENRRRKKVWEEKADEFLSSLIVIDVNKNENEKDNNTAVAQ